MRLVNQSYTSTTGLTATAGVVQVCVNREYGYVCADDWDDREAEVVCSSSFGYRAPYFGIIMALCYKDDTDNCCTIYEMHET